MPSRAAAALAIALAGCAHGAGGSAGPAGGPAPVWPAPPASPRVRWVASYLAPGSEMESRSWLRRAADAIVGVEKEQDRAPSGPLARPFGIAAEGDEIVVADPDAAQVLLLDARTGAHRALTCSSRPWGAPMAVALAPDRARYVADAEGVVVRLSAAGACTVIGAGRLTRPTGVAWLGDRVWVVDPPAHLLIAFAPDGRELSRVGGAGSGPDQLHFPSAVAAAPDGTLLVVDALNFRIVRFAADGRAVGAFGAPGAEDDALGRPKGVAVAPGGRILVTDALSDTVKIFDADGGFELAFGGSGAGPGQLLLPAGIAIAGRRVLVCDAGNRRISAYELELDA